MSEGTHRIRVQWTATAIEQMRALPPKVRRGFLSKADELIECEDPRRVHKPLVGPLAGFYRITYGRYRAIYTVREDRLADGKVLATITVTFIAAGKRAERKRDDVYQLAKKIVEMGVIDPTGEE